MIHQLQNSISYDIGGCLPLVATVVNDPEHEKTPQPVNIHNAEEGVFVDGDGLVRSY